LVVPTLSIVQCDELLFLELWIIVANRPHIWDHGYYPVG